jgi:uncharacterized heparinase superfamily protein
VSGRPVLYLRTVSRLRPSQVLHRARLRGQRALLKRLPPTVLHRPAPAAVAGWPAAFGALDLEPSGWPSAEDNAAGTFRFLEETRSLGTPPDWHQPGASQLWRYHLHYFEWAWTFAASPDVEWARAAFARLWDSWRRSVPVGRGDAWSPYVVSLRGWVWCGVHARLMAGSASESEWHSSLATHTAYLRAFLERDVGGNHFLKNLKALIGLGVFLGDDRLVATACRRLEGQLAVQVLADGGHYERSPSYHAQVLGDLIDVAGLLATAGSRATVPGLDEAIAAMRLWLGAMVRPDGRIPLFNDCVAMSADRLSPDVPPARPLTLLDPSGYAVLRSGPFHLVADVGVPCPPDLPAHAHADCLSFELSVDGRPVVVDTGVSTYEPGERRAYERSTAAHNTLEIDGADQTEVWGVFRAARRAEPRLEDAAEDALTASHDGYERLPGRPRHRRTWRMSDDRAEVVDEVTGSGTHRVVSRLHIAPGLDIRRDGDGIRVGPVSVGITGPGVTVDVVACELASGFGCRSTGWVIEASVTTLLPFELRTVVTYDPPR